MKTKIQAFSSLWMETQAHKLFWKTVWQFLIRADTFLFSIAIRTYGMYPTHFNAYLHKNFVTNVLQLSYIRSKAY